MIVAYHWSTPFFIVAGHQTPTFRTEVQSFGHAIIPYMNLDVLPICNLRCWLLPIVLCGLSEMAFVDKLTVGCVDEMQVDVNNQRKGQWSPQEEEGGRMFTVRVHGTFKRTFVGFFLSKNLLGVIWDAFQASPQQLVLCDRSLAMKYVSLLIEVCTVTRYRPAGRRDTRTSEYSKRLTLSVISGRMYQFLCPKK
ncbi:hypothetical protein HOLleu_06645 [Holothuria leucospilota]|uniref:Uncharacterized protein n=1 Tax=Holothuria leucospilota TaxID=206669 RepID=A0A9Q1CN67_HOLLE|nr:hypothetical protein HOLleu_06645 [Holothuria leucospilota]